MQTRKRDVTHYLSVEKVPNIGAGGGWSVYGFDISTLHSRDGKPFPVANGQSQSKKSGNGALISILDLDRSLTMLLETVGETGTRSDNRKRVWGKMEDDSAVCQQHTPFSLRCVLA